MRTAGALLVPPLAVALSLLAAGPPATGQKPEKPAVKKQMVPAKAVLVIHGGAGVLTEKEMAAERLEDGGRVTRAHYEKALAEALRAGFKAWKEKKTSVDAVEAAIRVMEDNELFNAGYGAALNHEGRAELDAALMEGRMKGKGEGKKDPRKRAGAVTGVTRVKNPISAARAVMEMPAGRHAFLAGEGADSFALRPENKKTYRIEEVSNDYFRTTRRLRDLRKALKKEAERDKERKEAKYEGDRADRRFGTVGAVALCNGTLAAGTSTGGLTNKLRGRVGDSPVLGAGTYADDRACGVSCSGTGEVFLRHAVAHDVVARMVYAGEAVGPAAKKTVDELPDEKDGGVGGLIALDRDGRHAFAMSEHSDGLYRGFVTAEGEVYVAVFKDDPWKRMTGKEKPGDDKDKKPPEPDKHPKGKGAVLFAGGALRFDNAAVWARFVELAGGPGAPVVVVPAASGNPLRSGEAVVKNLQRYGARAEVVPLAPMLRGSDYKAAARDEDIVAKLRKARGIWFLGGEQTRITRALLNDDKERTATPALKAIRAAHADGAVVGGSSAGAAIMSREMFARAMNSLDTIKYGIKKGVQVDKGLGFVSDEWFVDQHFLERGRFARALLAMREYGFKFGIGVDEDTAVVYKDGAYTVIGHNGALVLDIGDATTDSDLPAFNMKGARLTYLDAGDKIDAKTRVVTVSEAKRHDRKVDPSAKGFIPYYTGGSDLYYADMLASGAIYKAMVRALDSKAGVVKGLAFAQPAGGSKNDLGFELRVYRGRDTIGWDTASSGYDVYSVLNVHVDITPVRLASPLYVPLSKSSRSTRP